MIQKHTFAIASEAILTFSTIPCHHFLNPKILPERLIAYLRIKV